MSTLIFHQGNSGLGVTYGDFTGEDGVFGEMKGNVEIGFDEDFILLQVKLEGRVDVNLTELFQVL